jgi:hypothetical protein
MDQPENPLRALFAEALETTDTAQRAAFLNRACGPDASLRREVEELLQAEADAGKFLPEQPTPTSSRSALQELRTRPLRSARFPQPPSPNNPGTGSVVTN